MVGATGSGGEPPRPSVGLAEHVGTHGFRAGSSPDSRQRPPTSPKGGGRSAEKRCEPECITNDCLARPLPRSLQAGRAERLERPAEAVHSKRRLTVLRTGPPTPHDATSPRRAGQSRAIDHPRRDDRMTAWSARFGNAHCKSCAGGAPRKRVASPRQVARQRRAPWPRGPDSTLDVVTHAEALRNAEPLPPRRPTRWDGTTILCPAEVDEGRTSHRLLWLRLTPGGPECRSRAACVGRSHARLPGTGVPAHGPFDGNVRIAAPKRRHARCCHLPGLRCGSRPEASLPNRGPTAKPQAAPRAANGRVAAVAAPDPEGRWVPSAGSTGRSPP